MNGEAVLDESRGLPLGLPRRARSGRGRDADRPRPADGRRLAAVVATASTRLVERRVAFLYRLSERGLCARAIATLVEKVAPSRPTKAPGRAAVRSGGALSVQADGLQGRVRGGAALPPTAFRRSRSAGTSSGARQAALRVPSRAAASGAQDRRQRAARKKTSFGPWMMSAFGVLAPQFTLPARYAARHRSAIPRSAEPERALIADYEAKLE